MLYGFLFGLFGTAGATLTAYALGKIIGAKHYWLIIFVTTQMVATEILNICQDNWDPILGPISPKENLQNVALPMAIYGSAVFVIFFFGIYQRWKETIGVLGAHATFMRRWFLSLHVFLFLCIWIAATYAHF